MLAPFLQFFQSDGRHFQIVSQTIFVCIGVLFLRWDYSFSSMLLTFGVALSTQLIGIYFLKLPMHSIKSALITAFGLTLLFKSNEPLLLLNSSCDCHWTKIRFKNSRAASFQSGKCWNYCSDSFHAKSMDLSSPMGKQHTYHLRYWNSGVGSAFAREAY